MHSDLLLPILYLSLWLCHYAMLWLPLSFCFGSLFSSPVEKIAIFEKRGHSRSAKIHWEEAWTMCLQAHDGRLERCSLFVYWGKSLFSGILQWFHVISRLSSINGQRCSEIMYSEHRSVIVASEQEASWIEKMSGGGGCVWNHRGAIFPFLPAITTFLLNVCVSTKSMAPDGNLFCKGGWCPQMQRQHEPNFGCKTSLYILTHCFRNLKVQCCG